MESRARHEREGDLRYRIRWWQRPMPGLPVQAATIEQTLSTSTAHAGAPCIPQPSAGPQPLPAGRGGRGTGGGSGLPAVRSSLVSDQTASNTRRTWWAS